jgi:ubiquinone/menaquinone biosynthesis C-methylase UbiE
MRHNIIGEVFSLDLWALVLLIAISLLAIALAYGFTRLNIPRKVSFEGIEDPAVAEAYDRISRMPQFKMIRRAFVRELKKHNPKGSIVDIGCGPGYLLADIGSMLPDNRLVGVDISREMVEKARANLALKGMVGRAEFRIGEAAGLPFKSASQDFLVSTLSLHHWSDPAKALEEFHRVLKPGGEALIMDLRRDSRRVFYWLMLFAKNVALRAFGLGAITEIDEPLGSLLASYTVHELEAIIEGAPFVVHEVDGRLGWMYLRCRKGA